ncbi:unnamed protein product [Oppiella nova]|uniref:Myb-like, SWIRM and MPN domain-containing protein 1 n=1 Tax=Oppiella nova TaxID=334625 RepID=A0A7R9LVC4_9ACAR|nr:unnamed protein product [Oppiella nova]CAG2167016.1 unnamed protein product [Oppiella nova]
MAAVRALNGNTDSGIESDAECEPTVPLVVDFGSSVMTSRESSSAASSVAPPLDDCSPLTTTTTTAAIDATTPPATDDSLPTPLSSDVSSSSSASTPTSAEPTSSGVEDIADVVSATDATTDASPETTHSENSFRLCLASGDWLTISMENTSEYETQTLREFFDGETKGKSPESYREIRNHFLRHWNAMKPKRFGYHEMLKKVGHLHLGNVTAFSRVQKFLESHKAINLWTKSELKTTSPQKSKATPKRAIKRRHESPATPFAGGGEGGPPPAPKTPRTRPNPFKLVPLETFDAPEQAPFAVRLSMEALAIIDIHAHCVRTEVIGLLGGTYCALSHELFILTAEPCASLDDHDLQCDMEPVSQAIAKERLEQKSYACVGWYHSHPTFVPNPSLRDLETQTAFQTLFSRESNGQPFVAFILSPYMTSCDAPSNRTSALVSKFKCLWVSDKHSQQVFVAQNAFLSLPFADHRSLPPQQEYCVPMELPPLLVRREKLHFAVLAKLQDLCLKIKGHASRVRITNRIKRFRGLEVNHLEKLCHSLRHYLLETGLSSVECDHLLANCRNILLKHFGDDTTTVTSLTTSSCTH